MSNSAAPRPGVVYLVGAGPGDPRLLTLRAYELLRAAEIVAHDELVSEEILALAPPFAERLAVGRRRGQGTTSYRLHPLVLERARAGHDVVRLKAGDPLVFGRGGEEACELAEAGIGFEIVPGVSAALGAAAYAGIPLTHRAHASRVTFATGHRARGPGGPAGAHDAGAHDAGDETVVLYMATRALADNLAAMIAAGTSAATPAAYVAAATTPRQRVVVGTVGDLPARLDEAARAGAIDADAPALVIVGDVVALRARIAWFERQPLRGRRVLVARARPGRSAIAAELRALGAVVLEEPELAIAPVADRARLAAALAPAGLAGIAAIVFGCAAGVDAACELTTATPAWSTAVVAIGAAATLALRRRGVTPDLALDGACAGALAPHAARWRGQRLLVIAGDGGRPALCDELAALGAIVEVVTAYRQIAAAPPSRRDPVDLVVLPSSSAARAVLAGGGGASLRGVPTVVMGPRTESEARRLGAVRVVRAAHDTPASLVSRAVLELAMGGAA